MIKGENDQLVIVRNKDGEFLYFKWLKGNVDSVKKKIKRLNNNKGEFQNYNVVKLCTDSLIREICGHIECCQPYAEIIQDAAEAKEYIEKAKRLLTRL
jgi:hypothetical protein